jgi:hypothetical protein
MNTTNSILHKKDHKSKTSHPSSKTTELGKMGNTFKLKNSHPRRKLSCHKKVDIVHFLLRYTNWADGHTTKTRVFILGNQNLIWRNISISTSSAKD